MAAYNLFAIPVGLVLLFMNTWVSNTALLRTPLWLLWKAVVFWLINLNAKITCYGMTTDTLALMMMFGQVPKQKKKDTYEGFLF